MAVLHGERAVAALKQPRIPRPGHRLLAVHPRRASRGRIEAVPLLGRDAGRRLVIHGERAVAALKPCTGRSGWASASRHPRRASRGRIEAIRGRVGFPRPSRVHPRRASRGRIEAATQTDWYRTCASVIHGERAVAALKHDDSKD